MSTDGGTQHDHGPQPSSEWVLAGDAAIASQQLRALAPRLTLGEEHFDVAEQSRSGEGLPALYLIALQGIPVGAVDFLPLPETRTLMRLFLCSDLGTTCGLSDGDRIAATFASIWIERLRRLGFLTEAAEVPPRPPLGFPLPRVPNGL